VGKAAEFGFCGLGSCFGQVRTHLLFSLRTGPLQTDRKNADAQRVAGPFGGLPEKGGEAAFGPGGGFFCHPLGCPGGGGGGGGGGGLFREGAWWKRGAGLTGREERQEICLFSRISFESRGGGAAWVKNIDPPFCQGLGAQPKKKNLVPKQKRNKKERFISADSFRQGGGGGRSRSGGATGPPPRGRGRTYDDPDRSLFRDFRALFSDDFSRFQICFSGALGQNGGSLARRGGGRRQYSTGGRRVTREPGGTPLFSFPRGAEGGGFGRRRKKERGPWHQELGWGAEAVDDQPAAETLWVHPPPPTRNWFGARGRVPEKARSGRRRWGGLRGRSRGGGGGGGGGTGRAVGRILKRPATDQGPRESMPGRLAEIRTKPAGGPKP